MPPAGVGVVRAALIGLGPIGLEVGKALAARPGVSILGIADPHPSLQGQDVGALLRGGPSGHLVVASAAELYAASQPTRQKGDVAILCTGSRLDEIADQIESAIDAGLHVLSTCEELSFPYLHHARLAQRLDVRARDKGVVILGTGVNPGLVMDRLVLAVASACVRVDRVRVVRVVDAALRRGPLRAKVGAGSSVEEFQAGVAARRLGHVGLGESAAMVARGLRLPIDEVPETLSPVVGPDGRVQGLHQTARVMSAGRQVVELDLTMAVDAPSPHDRIVIEGDPSIDVRIEGGFQGDRATVGTVVNAVPYVVSAHPGLKTVIQLPLFGIFPIRDLGEDLAVG
jgi:4-hydroxy-tetrahydrodipicolinate reductase